MNKLKWIRIKGYRSIKSTELELGSLNIFIGPNGAGKSNLVSFFKMLTKMMALQLQEYIGTTGQAQSLLHFGSKITPQIESELAFATDKGTDYYKMRLFHAARDTLVFADEAIEFVPTGQTKPRTISLGAGHNETRIREEATKGEPIARVIYYLLTQCRVYHFHDTSSTARMRGYSYINDNRWLMPDAGNLAAMLFAYREKTNVVYQRIVSAVRTLVAGFDDFCLEPNRLNKNEIMLNWRRRGSDYLFGPHQISDGSLRAMAICTLLLQPDDDLPNVIILDEPELGLHPYALEMIARLMRAASEKTQIIAATQSQNFLNFFDPAEIITVVHNGASDFRRLEPDKLADWLEDYSIGELWQRNVLGGGPLP